jgi:hypothetical protein
MSAFPTVNDIIFDPLKWIPSGGQSTAAYYYASGIIGFMFAVSLFGAIYIHFV